MRPQRRNASSPPASRRRARSGRSGSGFGKSADPQRRGAVVGVRAVAHGGLQVAPVEAARKRVGELARRIRSVRDRGEGQVAPRVRRHEHLEATAQRHALLGAVRVDQHRRRQRLPERIGHLLARAVDGWSGPVTERGQADEPGGLAQRNLDPRSRRGTRARAQTHPAGARRGLRGRARTGGRGATGGPDGSTQVAVPGRLAAGLPGLFARAEVARGAVEEPAQVDGRRSPVVTRGRSLCPCGHALEDERGRRSADPQRLQEASAGEALLRRAVARHGSPPGGARRFGRYASRLAPVNGQPNGVAGASSSACSGRPTSRQPTTWGGGAPVHGVAAIAIIRNRETPHGQAVPTVR